MDIQYSITGPISFILWREQEVQVESVNVIFMSDENMHDLFGFEPKKDVLYAGENALKLLDTLSNLSQQKTGTTELQNRSYFNLNEADIDINKGELSINEQVFS